MKSHADGYLSAVDYGDIIVPTMGEMKDFKVYA